MAVFLACFYRYRQYLAPGERGTVMIVAADRKQARSILPHIAAMHGDLANAVAGAVRHVGVVSRYTYALLENL